MVSKSRRSYKVSVITPYLIEEMKGRYEESYIQSQIKLYGYDPNNLHGIELMKTKLGKIVELYPVSHYNSVVPEKLLDSDLIIYGSVEIAEAQVNCLKRSGLTKDLGLIIGRYSTFYGGPNRYSGNSPEESGYSLDIPKNVSTVKEILTNDDLLSSLKKKDYDSIERSINELNKSLQLPILITPYLREILK